MWWPGSNGVGTAPTTGGSKCKWWAFIFEVNSRLSNFALASVSEFLAITNRALAMSCAHPRSFSPSPSRLFKPRRSDSLVRLSRHGRAFHRRRTRSRAPHHLYDLNLPGDRIAACPCLPPRLPRVGPFHPLPRCPSCFETCFPFALNRSYYYGR